LNEHVLSLRRVIHGVTLQRIQQPQKPDYHVVLRLPKCL
jgi:hypothetical protein